MTNNIGKEIGIGKVMKNIGVHFHFMFILVICIITFTSRFQVGFPAGLKKKEKQFVKPNHILYLFQCSF